MKENWPFCGRMAYLSGGGVAVIEPQSDVITLWPKTTDGKVVEIKIDTFGKLYYALRKYNLTIVGVEFTTHHSEYIGEAPKQFRGYTEQEAIWPNWDAAQKWSELALSAFHNKHGLSYDLSNRISFQLKTINNRLRTLSSSYQKQLNALVLKNDFKAGQRFQDGYTDLVYQEFHSFLFDAGILRDNLCEYIYNFSGHGSRKEDGKEITTASGLFKSLKKAPNLTQLESYLKNEMSKGGWIFELGQYRDLVMHSAPINIANHRLFAIHEPITLPDGKELLSVRFPLPSNPSKLYSERCKRDDFDKYIEQFEKLSQLSLEDRGEYDCLEYAHKVSGLLSNLSLEVAKESPFKPMRQTFIHTNEGTISKASYVNES
ncbi:TPA: hypothetical protein I7712_22350 [Vibrio vulnificus]|nr:hypothetical protein [Vibrio vulnificus]HAS8510927.1 hypothetical protein [Vibrio vulnificus]